MNQNVHLRTISFAVKKDGHLFADGRAAESFIVLRKDVVSLGLQRSGTAAVNVLLEQLQNLGAPRGPLFCAFDFGAVQHHQRVWQLKLGHLRFVIVEFAWLSVGDGVEQKKNRQRKNEESVHFSQAS